MARVERINIDSDTYEIGKIASTDDLGVVKIGSGINIDADGTISASSSGFKILSTADYDWPAESPDGVAVWLLDAGLYRAASGVKIYYSADKSNSVDPKTILITKEDEDSHGASITCFAMGEIQSGYTRTNGSESPAAPFVQAVLQDDIIDNLDVAITYAPLSANQGKVLNDKIVQSESFSTTETETDGTWVDGKTIYKKTINFGALPNNTDKSVSNGFVDGVIDKVVKIEGYAYYPSTGLFMDLGGKDVYLWATSTDVEVKTYTDLSYWTECYITIYYTKN